MYIICAMKAIQFTQSTVEISISEGGSVPCGMMRATLSSCGTDLFVCKY